MRTSVQSPLRRALFGILVVGLFIGPQGCGPPSRRQALPEGDGLDAEERGPSTFTDDSDRIPFEGPPADALLLAIPSAPVVGFTGPGGEPLRVVLRTPDITHYPCKSCHIRPIGTKAQTLEQMHTDRPSRVGATRIDCHACHSPNDPTGLVLDCAECHEREGTRELMPSRTAHLTVRLSHPSGELRNCFTCHRPENPATLVLRSGASATLDEAYRLCSRCHFSQADSWAAGAHGKRVGAWQGDRLLLSCTSCHNPHNPKFPVRRPVAFPKIARNGSAW